MERILRISIFTIAAVAAAFLAFMLVMNMMGGNNTPQPATQTAQAQPQQAQQAAAPTTRVLVATRDLNVGERVSPNDLSWQAWPEAALNAAYIIDGGDPNLLGRLRTASSLQSAQGAATATMASLSGPQSISALNNAVVRVPILRGEPVLENKLVKADGVGVMSAVLTPGKKAMAMPVSVDNASGGFILPGDRVDVILSSTVDVRTDTGKKQSYVSDTILQNIKVLAIDQKPAAGEEEVAIPGATATLEVTTEQAEALAAALPMGRISLVLRSMADVNDPTTVKNPGSALGGAGGVRVIRAGRLSNS